MSINVWLRIAILSFLTQISLADDGGVQVVVEHAFGESGYSKRGIVRIMKSPSGDQSVEYMPGEWTKDDQNALLKAASIGGTYKIRSPVRFNTESISGSGYVMSSIPACLLVQSQLADRIHLSIDSSHQRVLSVAAFPLTSTGDDCRSLSSDISFDGFNTTLRLVDVVEGPVPETQAYLQKVEREKQERQRGEQGDNRSFLAKYWMYIIPVVIVLMLSSAMNPDAQGGGGNRH